MIVVKTIMILLLMICLISCNAPQIKPVVMCDISFQFNRCRCRCYNINELKTVNPKDCGLDIDVPNWNRRLEACEGISGFFVEDWGTEIIPKAKEIKRWHEDTCR